MKDVFLCAVIPFTFTFPVIKSPTYVAMVVHWSREGRCVAESTICCALSRLHKMAVLQDGKFTWFTDKVAVSMLPNR